MYHYFFTCDLYLGVWAFFFKLLTLLIPFKQKVLELWYFTWIFPVIRPYHGYHYFYPVTFTIEFDPIFENFNFANNFWTVSASALIFHVSIPCGKAFSWFIIFDLVTLTLGFYLIFENFKLALNNFWTVSARALIFHMSIPGDKTVTWLPLFWPCDLDPGVWPIFWKL